MIKKIKDIGQIKETETKDYMFQTIIDILNNPNVKALLDSNKGCLIDFNFLFINTYVRAVRSAHYYAGRT